MGFKILSLQSQSFVSNVFRDTFYFHIVELYNEKVVTKSWSWRENVLNFTNIWRRGEKRTSAHRERNFDTHPWCRPLHTHSQLM